MNYISFSELFADISFLKKDTTKVHKPQAWTQECKNENVQPLYGIWAPFPASPQIRSPALGYPDPPTASLPPVSSY